MKLPNRSCRALFCGLLLGASALTTGCAPSRQAQAAAAPDPHPAKLLVAEIDRGWLRYKVYRLVSAPAPAERTRGKASQPLVFSIMVVNMADGNSPLRKTSRDLADYNARYEYLLNGAKNDLVLQQSGSVSYPVYFSFENNYNSLPFETINVGYSLPGRRIAAPLSLQFVDRVFAGDTIRCDIPAAFVSL